METKEYYTPDIFELFIGYECQLQNIESAQWGKYVIKDTDCFKNFYEYIANNSIRTSYLCKQDIIDLDWENKQYVKNSELVYNFVKDEWYLEFWVGKIPYIEIGREGYDTGYTGNCKSKNELKKLMKDYLNIPI